MKKTLITFALLVGSFVATVRAENRSPDLRPLAQRLEVAAAIAVLDAWVTATTINREQPGLSLGIVYDQDLIWAKGYGLADLAHRVPAHGLPNCFDLETFHHDRDHAVARCRETATGRSGRQISSLVQNQECPSRRSGNHHPASADAHLGVAA